MRMKHRYRLSAVAAALVVLSACGGSDGDTANGTDTPPPPAAADDVDPFRVAYISTGTIDDLQYANGFYDGLVAAKAEFPQIEFEVAELLNEPDEILSQGAAFASAGFDFVLIGHAGMSEVAIQLAQQFPDTQWCLGIFQPAEGTDPQPANLCWFDVELQAANFLAGALAGLVTESDQVGSVNGFAFAPLTRQAEAFHLGARCTNERVSFSQDYINSWTDTGLARASSQSLIASGVDVLGAATDSAVLGMVEAARAADGQVWVVPGYYEQQQIGPDVVLTSVVAGLDYAVYDVTVKALLGELGNSEFFRYDITNNPLMFVPIYDNIRELLSAEAIAQFEAIDAGLRAGSIRVPDEVVGEFPIGAVGSGADVPLDWVGC